MQLSGMTRRPAFWVVFAAFSALCGALAWRYFPAALPLINLDVRMSRAQALEQGAALAAKLHLAPEGARAPCSSGTTRRRRTSSSWKPAASARFAALCPGDRCIRRTGGTCACSSRGETTEVRVRFRPDGTPDGFVRADARVASRRPALAADAARTIAENASARRLGRRFRAVYKLIEQSQQTRNPTAASTTSSSTSASERRWATARFRLRLGVSRRRAHRALIRTCTCRRLSSGASRRCAPPTTTIARVASLAAGLLYGLGGCVLGALWLLRRRALLWRPALVAAAVVAGLNARGGPAPMRRRRGSASTPRNRNGCSGGSRSASRWWSSSAAHWALRWCSWRRKACRAAPSPIIRSCGACGRATRRRRAPCSDARSAAICSCRSSSR